jgi:hypothetical protein
MPSPKCWFPGCGLPVHRGGRNTKRRPIPRSLAGHVDPPYDPDAVVHSSCWTIYKLGGGGVARLFAPKQPRWLAQKVNSTHPHHSTVAFLDRCRIGKCSFRAVKCVSSSVHAGRPSRFQIADEASATRFVDDSRQRKTTLPHCATLRTHSPCSSATLTRFALHHLSVVGSTSANARGQSTKSKRLQLPQRRRRLSPTSRSISVRRPSVTQPELQSRLGADQADQLRTTPTMAFACCRP